MLGFRRAGGIGQRKSTHWSVELVALGAIAAMGCDQTFATPRTSADVATEALGIFVDARSNGIVTQAFVSPLDRYGMLPLGPTDKLFMAEIGGPEKPFVPSPSNGLMVQMNTNATKFSLILVRGSKRFLSTIEMPPPFSLVAYRAYASVDEDVEVRWTPSAMGTDMLVACDGPAGQYDAEPTREHADYAGMLKFSAQKLQQTMYRRPYLGSSDDMVVTATRRGGQIILDSALAKIPHAGSLQQIRTVVVTHGAPPASTPPSAIAVDPAP